MIKLDSSWSAPVARVVVSAFALLSVGAMAQACASATESYAVQAAPDRSTFAPVAQALDHSCGTLDCHGTPYRNLRLYGNEGLRYVATDQPLFPACSTTVEVDQDYAGLIGLEPEVMAEVVATKGANPEMLLFVRKALGTEHHKGGTLMTRGDDLDTCISSWLAGATDATTCARAAPPTYPVSTPPACEAGP